MARNLFNVIKGATIPPLILEYTTTHCFAWTSMVDVMVVSIKRRERAVHDIIGVCMVKFGQQWQFRSSAAPAPPPTPLYSPRTIILSSTCLTSFHPPASTSKLRFMNLELKLTFAFANVLLISWFSTNPCVLERKANKKPWPALDPPCRVFFFYSPHEGKDTQ